MTNYKKLYELIHLTQHALNTCHYGRAEKLLRQMLKEAFATNDNHVISEISKTFLEYRRLRALEVLRILKRIDPIQAKRKELS